MNINIEVAIHINEIFLRHRQQILGIEECEGACGAPVIATGLKNLECMGYTLDAETIGKLRRTKESAVIRFFEQTQRAVTALVLNDPARDARLEYEPMYPGFPAEVMQMRSAELFINALLHYMSAGQWLPGHEKEPYAANSGQSFVNVRLRLLKTGNLEEFKEMFTNLMNANTSISHSDAEDLEFFFETFEDAPKYIPAEPKFKENNAVIAGICFQKGLVTKEFFDAHLRNFFKTATDVLRLAAVLSGGNASLAENCRFNSFPRSQRKLLLGLLDGMNGLLEDMMRRREVWLRLGERLHPGEYPGFGRVAGAFRKLRKNVEFHSFAGKVDTAFKYGFFDKVVELLSSRPGEFARTLDRVLRKAPEQQPVLDAFEAVADRVNTRVLLEVRSHFQFRSGENRTPMSEEERSRLLAEYAALNSDPFAEVSELAEEEPAEEEPAEKEEEKTDLASEYAIPDSAFDREKILDELDESTPLEGDALTAAVRDLASVMVENTSIAATDSDLHSRLKQWRKENEQEEAALRVRTKRGKARAKRTREPVEQLLTAKSLRVFLPKGELAKSRVIADTLPGIPEESCRRLVGICENALKRQYAQRGHLGKVWIADELKSYCVPFSQRSASKALKTIVRGSRLRFGDTARVIRGFLWWKNAFDGCERTDLDLSALLLDEKWRYVEHISYTNLRSPQINSCHSGDIVDAPLGAAEYIDIDIEAAQKAHVRYVVFSVHGFTMQDFCDLPECSFGWMERENAEGGERIFDASALGNKIDLAMKSRCGVPMIFDLKERCALWMDMTTDSPLGGWNSLESTSLNILAVCRGLAAMHKPDLYDLALLHAEARGELAASREEADTVFGIDEGITPFDTDVWMAQYI